MENLNENPREGINILSACTDAWIEIMSSLCKSQDERVLELEHNILTINTGVYERDIGVLIDGSLKPSVQCAKAVGKASLGLGQITWTFLYHDRITFLSDPSIVPLV